jgi:hypothetical protein
MLSWGQLGRIKLNNSFTYVGKKSGGEGIESKIAMKVLAAKRDGACGLLKLVKSDIKGDGKATSVFDAAKGRLASTTTSSKMSGNMTIEAGGMEFQVATALETNSTLKVHDKNPLQK